MQRHKRREKVEQTCFFVPVLKSVTLLVKNAGLQAATASGDQTALHRIMGGQLSVLQRMEMGLVDARILTILPFHLHTSFGTGEQSHVHTELMMCS